MQKIETKLKDCYILKPDKFGDDRGYFSPYFIEKNLQELGFKRVVQANRSNSSKGIVRGLHFQKNPKCQAKIVEVIKGSAIDVVVDLRIDSPTYGKYITVLLTDKNNTQLFVPRGFAHGFVSLEDDTTFQYLVDNDYAPKMEAGILWNDPTLNINWNKIFTENNITNPILSDKDQIHPTLENNNVIFKREQERYLITGVNGQLGYEIKKELIKQGIKEENILAPSKNQLDITNRKQTINVIEEFKPDVIFHCAAFTSVDEAESNNLVNTVNVDGTKNIVDASNSVGSKIIYISTDYVFDGKKEGIYTTEDKPNPLNIYGTSKYLAEEIIKTNPNHFIARISWLYGINGNNFVKTMLKLAETHDFLNVVDDQIGSPTYVKDLAYTLTQLAQTNNYGTYHITNEGFCSWAEFAQIIFEINNKNVKVNKVTTEEYLKITGSKQADRPKNSRLDKSKLEEIGLEKLPTWQDAVKRYSEELEMEKLILKRGNR